MKEIYSWVNRVYYECFRSHFGGWVGLWVWGSACDPKFESSITSHGSFLIRALSCNPGRVMLPQLHSLFGLFHNLFISLLSLCTYIVHTGMNNQHCIFIYCPWCPAPMSPSNKPHILSSPLCIHVTPVIVYAVNVPSIEQVRYMLMALQPSPQAKQKISRQTLATWDMWIWQQVSLHHQNMVM